MSKRRPRSSGPNSSARSRRSIDHPQPARPWCHKFLRRYEQTGDLIAVCRALDVTFAEVRRIRIEDPVFDRAMQSLDQVVRSTAAAALEARAASGDVRAMALLLKRQKELDRITAPAEAPTLPATIRAAAVRAYHDEAARLLALAERADPPVPSSVLEGRPICPDCRRPVPPWYEGGNLAVASFDAILADAWEFHNLRGTVPMYAHLCPDPSEGEGNETLEPFLHVRSQTTETGPQPNPQDPKARRPQKQGGRPDRP